MMLKKSLVLGAMFSLAAAACGGAVEADDGTGAVDESASAARETPIYLALGDSVAFGHDPFGDWSTIATFEGYPELIGKELGSSARVLNPSCVGESSGSFIDRAQPDNGCSRWRAGGLPMHVAYASSAQSQLQYALATINAKKGAIKAITLQIGANDVLMLSNRCSQDPATYAQCASAGLQNEVYPTVYKNVRTILGALRSVYSGPLALVTYHANNFAPSLERSAMEGLNAYIVQAGKDSGVTIVANGFAEFEAVAASKNGDPCAAGLLIPKPDGTGCDFHPSEKGQGEYVEALKKIAMPKCD